MYHLCIYLCIILIGMSAEKAEEVAIAEIAEESRKELDLLQNQV